MPHDHSGHSHSHGHSHHGHHHGSETGNIAVAFWLNFSFSIIELIGGLLTNSVAILADAMHDLGDSLAIAFAWAAAKVSGKAPNQRYSYGYRRWSLLSALVNSLILVLGSCWILYEAVPRLWDPVLPHAPGMMALAVLGVLVNGAAVLKLRLGKTQNEQVLTWHLLEDVFGWVAVLVGSLLIYLTGWAVIDPLLSIGFTLFILLNVWRNLRRTFGLFLQVSPDPALTQELEEKLQALNFVSEVHHLHLWSLDGEKHVLTAHLVLTVAEHPDLPGYKQQIRELLAPYRLQHTTIEFEFAAEACRDH
ncbi:cation diffusion facilitator family transporter [Rheinheimera sp.]|uniref:cation diffusion facilitator family transporter n=1 Tax=Rheinheimera sp. TaxID=1869214 RepID=UPI00307F916E